MTAFRSYCFIAALAGGLVIAQAEEPGPLAPALRSAVDKHIVAGVVGWVADEKGVREVDVAGESSIAEKSPMKPDALFWIASMTKSFTGTALMILVDEGKLSLDDAVEKYLPEFKGQMVAANPDNASPHPPRHPITIREIMDHTSGLVLASDKSLRQTHSLKDDVAQYAAHPLRHEPGSKFEYNNCGINTGGRVIEVVSGISYADFMQQRIFTPLGLKETTFWPDEALGKRLAMSAKSTADKSGLEEIDFSKGVSPALIERLGKGVSVPHLVLANFGIGSLFDYSAHYAMPAGGLFSTANDIARFCRMLLNGGALDGRRYLSPEALRQMTEIQTGDVMVNPDEGYGVGWFIQKKEGMVPAAGTFGHRGARKTVMWVDPSHHLAMGLMVQSMDMTGPQQNELYKSFLNAVLDTYGTKH